MHTWKWWFYFANSINFITAASFKVIMSYFLLSTIGKEKYNQSCKCKKLCLSSFQIKYAEVSYKILSEKQGLQTYFHVS